MTDVKNIDVAFVLRTKDENGKPLTRTLPDGTEVPDPMIFTQNYGDLDGVRLRVSLWDLDNETLHPLLSNLPGGRQPPVGEMDEFFALQHSRMQDLSNSGTLESREKDFRHRREIDKLQSQIKRPSND